MREFVSNGCFFRKWWIQSMSLGTLREMPHWAFVIYNCPPKNNFQFLAKFQKIRGTLVTMTVPVKTFSLENVSKMNSHRVSGQR